MGEVNRLHSLPLWVYLKVIQEDLVPLFLWLLHYKVLETLQEGKRNSQFNFNLFYHKLSQIHTNFNIH